ncbi:MAG: TolC family protein [Deltaproteobacteria bacterium]|nr:TolC family protein [Deltaproteobacteria bacterium]
MMYLARRKKVWRSNQTTVAGALFAGIVSLLPVSAHAQCGELTWLEAINQALDANQALVAARQTLDAQHKDIAIARATMLPGVGFGGLAQLSKDSTFSSSAGVVPERTLQVAGKITQTLYNQGDIDVLGSQKHLYLSQQESFEDTRNQTIAAAGQDYLGVLLAEALVALQQDNLGLSKQSLDLTKAQESSGQVPYRNVLRWQTQLYAAERQLVAQEGSLLASRFRFNQVRNRPGEEICKLEELTVNENGFIFASEAIAKEISDDAKAALARDYLVALGLERSVVLRSLDAEIKAEQRKMKSARRWLIPSLDAAAAAASFVKTDGAGSDEQQDGEIFWQVGLTLDWSVLDGGAYIATMNQSKAEFWSLRSQRTNAATSLEENIRSTAAAAMASFEQIGLAEKEAQASEENYKLVNEAYLQGEAALIEQIDGQQQLIQANTAARQALYQFLSDVISLEQSIAYYPFLEGDAGSRVHELEAKLQGARLE